ncbi:MAG: hypothetical protein ACFFDI_26475 [Promethearchaeota archaeon]
MSELIDYEMRKIGIFLSRPVLAMICIVFGILVILFQDLLPLLVGVFFILEGILLGIDYLELRRR